jgi:hypothetical protein
MWQLRLMPKAAKLSVAGLAVAAAGMVLEIAAGSVLYPTLTGPIVLVVTALTVAIGPGRWAAYLGFVVPLVLAVGLVVSAVLSPIFLEQLIEGTAGLVLGSVSHAVGLLAAVLGGLGMVLQPHRATVPGT